MEARNVLVLACVLCTSLSGCAVGPSYTAPEPQVADSWQVRQNGRLVTVNAWWRQFDDPALMTLLDRAQASSPSLAKAAAAIDKARASLDSTAAGLWPSVDASATASESGSLRRSNTRTWSGSATLDASWELDLFGKTRRNLESASALVGAQLAGWHDARVSLAAEVATDYVDYRACRIKQHYYEQQADSQDRSTAMMALALRAGLKSPDDVRVAQASAATTRASALAQETECEVEVKALVALTGLTEGALRDTLGGDPEALPQPAGLAVDKVPADVVRQRPDVIAAERNLASSSALIGAAQAARWPSLSLSGSIGRARSQGSDLSLPWSFGPSLSLPVFDGGAIEANVRSARADYASNLASYQQTVRDAVKEVEQALVRLERMAEREDVTQRSVDRYGEYLASLERSRNVGSSSQQDIETARRSLISAQINLIDLRQSRLTYWISLYKAVGGGWQDEQGDMP